MAQRVVAWDDTTDRLKRTTKDPADIGTASSTGEAVNAGSQTVTSGTTSQAVTFVNAFSNTLYGVAAQLVNVTDATVQYQPLTMTAKSTSGFTVKWNVPTDSANYVIDYIAVDPCVSYRAGRATLASAATDNSFEMFLAGSNAIESQFINTTDASPQFQPITISLQEATLDLSAMPQYTAEWNAGTDTANYAVEFIGNNTNCSTIKSFITDVSNGATSAAISFPYFDIESASFAVVARFMNITDSSVLYQPITITSKSVSGFTAKWNTPTDSAEYKIEWIANTVTVA